MPPTSTLRRTIRKQRQQSCNPYSVPATREDVVLPGEYTVSLKQEAFVAHDSGFGDRNRILVFATQRNLDYNRHFSRLFAVLSSLLTQPAVELVYCDFESAAIIATGNIFPQARV
ncbi:unnamed protein product [Ixodes pacificus]